MGGHSSGTLGPTKEQLELEEIRKRKDKEMQEMLLDRIKNMRGAGGKTSGVDSDSNLG